jgi:opacity protein-like surface antigen
VVVRLSLVFAVAFLTSALPRPAHAQERGEAALAAALARVSPGSTVRVQTHAGAVLEGALQLAGDSVRLDAVDRVHVLALTDIRSAWLRERRTRTGAVVGALLGGAGGGAFLGFLGLVADIDEAGKFAAIGVLGGAGAGALLGGVVGAAVPRWTLIHPTDAVDVATPAPSSAGAGRRRIGALEAAAGFGRIGGHEPTDGGAGGRLGLHAEFGADPAPARDASLFFSLGPEIGWFDLGSTGIVRRTFVVDPSSPSAQADTLEFSRSFTAFTAGGLLRLGLSTGRVRGYGIAGLAYNRWEYDQRDVRWLGPGTGPPAFAPRSGRFEHVGFAIGAGGQAALGRAAAITLELRRTTVGTFDMDLPGHYWSITVGASRRW